MVMNRPKKQTLFLIIPPIFEEQEIKELKWTSVKLSEIQNKQNRLEAGVYDIEVKKAFNLVENCKYELIRLFGIDGFTKNAFYPGRFKRIYCESNYGEPFFLPSQLNEINPKPSKFISHKTKFNFNELKIKEGQLLLTRSGTIGNISISSKTIENKLFSDDVIRCSFDYSYDLGFVYAFLESKTGQAILKNNKYGAVIQHIEPEHLHDILIPNPPDILKKKIHDKIIKSFDLRDDSNSLIYKAEKLLIQELKLPPIDDFKPKYYKQKGDLKTFNVKQSDLKSRFDGSFHVPIVDSIIHHLKNHSDEITTIGDTRISERIVLPGRFKRVYVKEGQGVVFIGSKQILELDPSNKKYLSISHHNQRIKNQLLLHQNSIIISCSGTIGKVAIVPKHWKSWSASQHVLRIIPKNDEIAGFIYAWLNTDYGEILLKRFTYGSVVDEIDSNHVSLVQIPFLKNKEIQKEINDLVLKANELRYEAYKLEQEAIKIVNEEVIFAN